MYKGKRKVINLAEYNERRQEIIKKKGPAIYNSFAELEELVNTQALAHQYFAQPTEWLAERLEAHTLFKDMLFTADECHELAEAFRDIARRLNAHADEIDAAKMD